MKKTVDKGQGLGTKGKYVLTMLLLVAMAFENMARDRFKQVLVVIVECYSKSLGEGIEKFDMKDNIL